MNVFQGQPDIVLLDAPVLAMQFGDGNEGLVGTTSGTIW